MTVAGSEKVGGSHFNRPDPLSTATKADFEFVARSVVNADDPANAPDDSLDSTSSPIEGEGPENAEAFRAKAEDNGWTVVEEDDELPPMDNLKPARQDETTLTYQYKGTTYAVSEHVTPFKYSVLESKLAGVEIRRTDNNININVPESAATDFMNAETTEGGKTVSELFNENMKNEWSSLDLSDPRRQYLELLQAQAALVGGYDYLPNLTKQGVGSDTTSVLPDPVVMDAASTYGLLKEEDIGRKLSELAEDESIVAGIDGFMEDAVSKIKDKNGLTNKVYATMTSDEYKDMLEGMDPDGARVRFANDLKSLEMLDADKAAALRNDMVGAELIDKLDEIVSSGSYTDEALPLAIQDQTLLAFNQLYRSISATRNADKMIQNYLKGKEGIDSVPEHLREKARGLKQAYTIFTDSILESFKKNGQFDVNDAARNMAGMVKSAGKGLNGYAIMALEKLNAGGYLSTVGGAAAITAGIYMLTKTKGDTPEERIAAARAFSGAMSTLPYMAKVVASPLGKALNNPGMLVMLGLENNTQLQEMFGKHFPKSDDSITAVKATGSISEFQLDDLVPDGGTAERWAADLERRLNSFADGEDGARSTVSNSDFRESYSATSEILEDVESRQGSVFQDAVDDMPEAERSAVLRAADEQIRNGGGDPSKVPTSTKLRLFGTVFNVAAALGGEFAGGILDIVMGGMTLDKLVGNPNALPGEYAGALLQMGAGVGGVVAGGATLAAMITGSTVLASVAGGAAVVGFGLGAIALIVIGAVAKQKQEQALNDTAQDFKDWETLDVTEDNWGDKFNYLQNARYAYNYEYGSGDYFKHFPDDKPVWEARPEQYKDFTEYLKDHSSLPDGWFDDWDEGHDVEINGFNNPDEHDGRHVVGSDDKSNKPGHGAGTFNDFKEDVDLVDVGTIELKDDGWIHFVKNGYEQAVKAGVGDGWDNDNDSNRVADYLTQIYELTHPDGELDEDIVSRITKLHDGSDKYNDIEALRRVLSEDFVPMLGKDDNSPGNYDEFEEDVDRVDIDAIEVDSGDSSVIYFVKDGKKWMLDKDDHGSLEGDDAKKIFTYLYDIHNLIRPDGENIDNDVVKEISKKHDEGDGYNDIDDMREHLVEKFPEKYKDEAASFGVTCNEEGSVNHNKIGTPSDFIEDVDRVDVGTVAVSDDGRKVVFVKDGIKQRIADTNDTNGEIVKYLKSLHDLVDGDEKRAREMDRLLGATDDYNDLGRLKAYMDPPKPRTWADETPKSQDGLMKVPNQDQDEFKEDMDKVDAASLRVVDEVVYFTKNGEWHSMGPGYGGDMRHIYNQLVMVANMTNNGQNHKLAARIDQIWDRGDDYNEANELETYLKKIGAL